MDVQKTQYRMCFADKNTRNTWLTTINGARAQKLDQQLFDVPKVHCSASDVGRSSFACLSLLSICSRPFLANSLAILISCLCELICASPNHGYALCSRQQMLLCQARSILLTIPRCPTCLILSSRRREPSSLRPSSRRSSLSFKTTQRSCPTSQL